jgi:hypothetical protein
LSTKCSVVAGLLSSFTCPWRCGSPAIEPSTPSK